MSFDRSYEGGKGWAMPKGSGRGLSGLIRYRTNRNVVELAAVVQAVLSNAPTTAPDTDLESAFDSLRKVPPGVLSRVVRHPSFGYWLSALKHLLRVQVGLETPRRDIIVDGHDDHILNHYLLDLQRFAVTARLISLESFELTFTHANPGPLVFPTTGIAIEGISLGQPVHVRVESELSRCRVTLREGARTITIATDQPWSLRETPNVVTEAARGLRALPVYRINGSLPGYEIDPWDPYYRLVWVRNEAFPDNLRAPMATEDSLPSWQTTLCTATDLMNRHHPEIAAEVSEMIASLIPISAASPDSAKSLSVTAPEFWGSHPVLTRSGAHDACEVLVHEYRHNLLHALNDLDPLFQPNSPA